MFDIPKNGWVNLKIENYISRVSYITNVVEDCLNAFIYGLKTHKSIIIDFDAEGWELKLICDSNICHIIANKDIEKDYNKEEHLKELNSNFYLVNLNKNLRQLAMEFVDELELNFDIWIESQFILEEDINKYKVLLGVLKNLLERKN